MKRVHTIYRDIFADLTEVMRPRAHSEKDLHNMESTVKVYVKMFVEMFDEHCYSIFFILKY